MVVGLRDRKVGVRVIGIIAKVGLPIPHADKSVLVNNSLYTTPHTKQQSQGLSPGFLSVSLFF